MFHLQEFFKKLSFSKTNTKETMNKNSKNFDNAIERISEAIMNKTSKNVDNAIESISDAIMDKTSKNVDNAIESISDEITDKTSKHWDDVVESFIDAKDTIYTELIKIFTFSKTNTKETMDKNSKKCDNAIESFSDAIMDKTSKHWDDAIESFIDAISKDTKCTELIKILIETFFQDDSFGIFSLLPERSRNMLRKEDVSKEFKQRQNDIGKIKKSLINYRDAPKSGRADRMEDLVKLCDKFYNDLVTGKNMDN
ncbi:9217_t:CDS:1, partial [Gigaspora margarita]